MRYRRGETENAGVPAFNSEAMIIIKKPSHWQDSLAIPSFSKTSCRARTYDKCYDRANGRRGQLGGRANNRIAPLVAKRFTNFWVCGVEELGLEVIDGSELVTVAVAVDETSVDIGI